MGWAAQGDSRNEEITHGKSPVDHSCTMYGNYALYYYYYYYYYCII